ncbi:carbohydrate-binding protein [Chitinophaga pendula]|uniref:carbohydrate-binding protein n=1 Tax=Chitinophaga TaxID=79328 RepID=UPI000BB07A5E|nr:MULTISPECIES: carbohydrate-binding protein [Chitinophaga]ASZ14583.1 carbohydrate-binding protein [Chitinophaga sp. MD30]UCJ07765.1 carbohydrate-binding protein [Chitinophaga pendula]
MSTNMSLCKRFLQTFVLLALLLTAAFHVQAQAPRFKVIAFYNGTFDAAHINFVKEANQWFPTIAAQYNFSYEATNNWNNLNLNFLSQYQVVLFLDDQPFNAAQRTAFQQYMENGGGWMGFHVCAFTTNPSGWSWYHNTFLGSGSFRSNTWGPTTAVLKCEDQTHPSTQRLPGTFTSAVSEWYSWSNDLRNNGNIRILCSVDPVSFPLGTDPNQSWYSGYYPIIWTNRNYKMLYANFGHNDMNYTTNTAKSSTFASEIQNRFIIDGLLWLGGVGTGPAPALPIPGTVQAESFTTMSGIQTEVTTDAGGGQNVGYTDAGDWLDYKVKVQAAGTYNVQYRVASQNGGGSIQLRSGSNVLATTAIPSTGGWQVWTTVNATATLAAGEQTLRIHVASGGFNLNWIRFASASNPSNAPVGQVITLRGNNNQYVSSENGTKAMLCTRPAPQTWEQFSVVDAGGGKVALRSMAKYVSSENGAAPITCNRAAISVTEQFEWIQNDNGTISLRGSNGNYVSSENGVASMTCSRPTAGAWEQFTFTSVGAVQRSFTAPEKEAGGIVVYPNPFGAQLNYTLPDKYSTHTAVLYDLSGRAQLRSMVKVRQGNYSLDVSKLPKGLYILDISSGDYHQRTKVQKAE